MGKNKKDFKIELTKLLELDKDSTINEIINHISYNYINDVKLQNQIFQYLRKISINDKKNSDIITQFLINLGITQFRTFKVDLSNAYSGGNDFEGDIQIYLNNIKILGDSKIHAKNILISNLINWKISDHVNKDILKPNEKDCVFTTGCGCIGCCPGLFWDVKHKNNAIIIKNVFFDGGGYKPEERVKRINGEYRINKDDYIFEVNRLSDIHQKAKSKTGVPWKKPSKKFLKKHHYLEDNKLKPNFLRSFFKIFKK
ncbi:hypothetical protein HYU17_02165 [Candidatus Woesearchaeota archaeon]|nr:hypothetical protein [Candidatus Woesearchaeota archaeon]